MTKEKWHAVTEELCAVADSQINCLDITPENVPHFKRILETYLADLDDVTEVYNMENKLK